MALVGGLGRRLVHIQMEVAEVEMMGGMQAIQHLSRVEGGLHTMHGMAGQHHMEAGEVEEVGEKVNNTSSVFGIFFSGCGFTLWMDISPAAKLPLSLGLLLSVV